MVMSTTFEIGRWPAAISRAFSHGGLGPICTSSNTRAVNRGQRSVSTLDPDVLAEVAGAAGILGPRRRVSSGAPVAAWTSRATP